MLFLYEIEKEEYLYLEEEINYIMGPEQFFPLYMFSILHSFPKMYDYIHEAFYINL